MTQLARDLVDRLTRRAQDPSGRTYAANAEANAAPMDIGSLMASLQQHAPAQAQGLLGAFGNLRSFSSGFGSGLTMMGPGGPVSLGKPKGPRALATPAAETAIAEAERAIGHMLPPEVRQLYAIADGGFGPGGGLFPVAVLAERYRDLTCEPYRPNGEEWPKNLLPLFSEDPQLLSIDLANGEIICWDPEELEDETPSAWERSFKAEARSLSDLLEGWLGEPNLEEQMAAEMRAARANVPQATIDYYARMTPEERAGYGFTGEDWEDQLRRRFAAG